jgi:hypothetical protein
MSQTKLARVAFVRFSPNGKSYPVHCERKDITEGMEVEVLMRANTPDSYYMIGVVDFIEHHRWNCKSKISYPTSEINYLFNEDGLLERTLKSPELPEKISEPVISMKTKYPERLPTSTRREMREIYDAVANNDGEDAYLSDGVWINANGQLEDRSI